MLGIYVFIFAIGIVIGSFLNVVIIRLKTKESIFIKPSHCVFCKKKLTWFELIPIISFIIQKGKCRKCKKKISWQYPLVEFFTGLIFVLIFIYELPIFWFLISCFLIVLFVYDLKYYLVSDKIIYPAIVLTFLYKLQFSRFANPGTIFNFQSIFNLSIFNYLLAGLIGGAFFLAIVLISRGKWMGMGDAKIGFLMGLLLGLNYLFVALFLAFFIGAIISIILLILKKKTLKSEIPFGPFLIGATFITLFWGEILINWYLGLFM